MLQRVQQEILDRRHAEPAGDFSGLAASDAVRNQKHVGSMGAQARLGLRNVRVLNLQRSHQFRDGEAIFVAISLSPSVTETETAHFELLARLLISGIVGNEHLITGRIRDGMRNRRTMQRKSDEDLTLPVRLLECPFDTPNRRRSECRVRLSAYESAAELRSNSSRRRRSPISVERRS